MSEVNGNRDTRLDRIEKALELFIADHEEFRRDHKQLLTAQVIQSEQIDKLLKVTDQHSVQIGQNGEQIAAVGKRVDDLVSAIGKLIAANPPMQ